MKRMSLINSILRWLTFLPVATLVTIILSWILPKINNLIHLTIAPDSVADNRSFIENIVIPYILGFAFVAVGCWVAPAFKRVVAIILGCIHLLFGVVFFILIFTSEFKLSDIQMFGVIAQVLGAASVVWVMKDYKDKEQL